MTITSQPHSVGEEFPDLCTAGQAGDPYPQEARSAPSSPSFSQQVAGELPFLRRIVRRWRHVGADADDLVQDTLMRALASAHLYQPGSNLRAWLFTIMRNQFLANHARSKRADAALQAYADVNPARALENQQARLTLRDVKRAMERMPKVQRLALMLVGAEGNSHEDVARDLEISTGAVRCHLTRARARLRNDVHLVAPSSPFARIGSREGERIPKPVTPVALR